MSMGIPIKFVSPVFLVEKKPALGGLGRGRGQSRIGGYFPLTESRYMPSLKSIGSFRRRAKACFASSFVSIGSASIATPIMGTIGNPSAFIA